MQSFKGEAESATFNAALSHKNNSDVNSRLDPKSYGSVFAKGWDWLTPHSGRNEGFKDSVDS